MSFYAPRPWTPEKRERVRMLALRRWGNPEGCCTVYGIHVPLEHREPLRHWAGRVAEQYGREEAERFVNDLKGQNWAAMSRVRELWLQRKQAYRLAVALRYFNWELRNANKNSR